MNMFRWSWNRACLITGIDKTKSWNFGVVLNLHNGSSVKSVKIIRFHKVVILRYKIESQNYAAAATHGKIFI